jgi:hypothetical protein
MLSLQRREDAIALIVAQEEDAIALIVAQEGRCDRDK